MGGLRRRVVTVFSVLIVAAFAASTVSVPATAAPPQAVWTPPQLAVPTTTNIGDEARVTSVSCSSAGNCAAGGYYRDAAGRQAFVISQTAGVWGTPQLVVPTTTNTGGNARVTSVSCLFVGNCAAGGYYADGGGRQAFVVAQTGSVWGTPRLAVPTTTNIGGYAEVLAVSCPLAGNCTAGGFYTDGADFNQAFVVSQTAGVWGTHQLAVPTATNSGGFAAVSSVSCSSAGNCAAGGYYRDSAGQQAFVVAQTGGTWGTPQLAVPTTTNTGADARVTSVSCSPDGNCAAGGYYTAGGRLQQAFVVSQTSGVWGTPRLAVPITTNTGGFAQVRSVSCSSTGNCAAGGTYNDGVGQQAFVVSQTIGVWGTTQLVVPTTTNTGNNATVDSVSCASMGNCSAGGFYNDVEDSRQAFVVTQTGGVWGTPQLAVPTTTNTARFAQVNSVSCASAGNCSAGGTYADAAGTQAFVLSSISEDLVTFADVGPTHPFFAFVQWMAAEGISVGTAQPSGKPLYKPADAVSRQAMALFMYRLSGETFVPPVTSTFADVATSSQFYTAVEWMYQRNISTGTAQPSGKPLFKPSDPVSRQAMALFVARYAGADLSVPPTTQRFADVPLGSPAAAAIDWMFTTGVSTGTAQPSGLPLYKPANPVTRQAMAAFLYRVDNLSS